MKINRNCNLYIIKTNLNISTFSKIHNNSNITVNVNCHFSETEIVIDQILRLTLLPTDKNDTHILILEMLHKI